MLSDRGWIHRKIIDTLALLRLPVPISCGIHVFVGCIFSQTNSLTFQQTFENIFLKLPDWLKKIVRCLHIFHC